MNRNVYVQREYNTDIPHVSLRVSRAGAGKAKVFVSTVNQSASFALSKSELEETIAMLQSVREDWE